MLPPGTYISFGQSNAGTAYLVSGPSGATWRSLPRPPQALDPAVYPILAGGYTSPETAIHFCGLHHWDNSLQGGPIWHQRFEPPGTWTEQVDVGDAAGGGVIGVSVGGYCVRGFPEGPPPYDALVLYICTTDGGLRRTVRGQGGGWEALEDVFAAHGVVDTDLRAYDVAAALTRGWLPGVDVEHLVVATDRGLWHARRSSSAAGVQRSPFMPVPVPNSFGRIACAASQSRIPALHLCYTSSAPLGHAMYIRLEPAWNPAITALLGGIWTPVTDVSYAAAPRASDFNEPVACGASGDTLFVTTLSQDGSGIMRLLCTSRSDEGTWTPFVNLGSEVSPISTDPNRGFTTRAAFVPGPWTPAVRYGMTLKLRHAATGFKLHSHPFVYGHPGSSGQQQVTCFAGFDDNDFWRIKGPDGQAEDWRFGEPVRDGDVVRLEHVATRRNLHSHAGFPSPVTGQQEVTCFGGAGIGDGNDDWRVELAGGGEWDASRELRLIHVPTDHALHSHRGYSDELWTMGQQEVTAFAGRDGNDLWFVSNLPERDADFVSQQVPSTLQPGQSQDVSVTMRNLGTETWTAGRGYRLGSYGPPDNTTWGLARADVLGTVAPGEQVTFPFRVTAPATTGLRRFQWRMVRGVAAWFGEATAELLIPIFADAGPTTVPDVIGLRRTEAARALRAAELVPRFVGPVGALAEAVAQVPDTGTSVLRGSTVTVVLSFE